mgnify:CR=1 FL=1
MWREIFSAIWTTVFWNLRPLPSRQWKRSHQYGTCGSGNLKIATAALTDRNESFCQEVFDNEKKLNHLDTELTDYLVKINNLSLNDSQHLIVKNLFYTIGDVERIGDHAENLAELAQINIKNNREFSESGLNDLKEDF